MPTKAVRSPCQPKPPRNQTTAMASEPIIAMRSRREVERSRTIRAQQSAAARRQPCRPYQDRGKSAAHHSHQQASARASGPRCGAPSNHAGQSSGEVRCRKSKPHSPPPIGTASGSSVRGQAAASSSPIKRAGDRDLVGNDLLVRVDERRHQHQDAEHGVRGKLQVQNGKPVRGQRPGNCRGQQAAGRHLPPVEPRQPNAGQQFQQHGPHPETGAVQGRFPP